MITATTARTKIACIIGNKKGIIKLTAKPTAMLPKVKKKTFDKYKSLKNLIIYG
jgi:hypothetical protein